jgi:hypothetical protein
MHELQVDVGQLWERPGHSCRVSDTGRTNCGLLRACAPCNAGQIVCHVVELHVVSSSEVMV